MMNENLQKIMGILSLMSCGLIALSYGFLFAFQKDCSYCAVLIGPLFYFSFLALNAFLSLKSMPIGVKYKMLFLLFNAIGILSAIVYGLVTFLP